MTRRLALVTSNPPLALPFAADHALHQALELEIAVAVWVHPSMRFLDRFRELRRTLRRRARINHTRPTAQLLHHLAYLRIDRASRSGDLDDAARQLSRGRPFVEARSVNEEHVAAAIRGTGCSLVVVIGSDILTAATIERLGIALFNVHFGDPAFVRGLPAVFWEILGGRDVIHLTLHELVPMLDAGPVVAQREVPIVWQPSLAATIRKTREAAALAVPGLLREGLGPDGGASPVRRAATLGPLRTTPRVGQMLAASGVCRHRYRAALQG
jgi:hypothetical protein